MSDEKCDIEQNLQTDAAVSMSTDEQSPRIFKMNIDCFEELFEWLSLKDLLVLRQTSKYFKELAEYYIKLNYPAAFKLGQGKVTIFSEYRPNIDQFRRLDPSLAKLIKKIIFWSQELSDDDINDFKPILSQIEDLQTKKGQIEGEFHWSILRHCPKLKRLTIVNIECDLMIGNDNSWLSREYPQLECVDFDDSDIGGPGNAWPIPEVKPFFELNPNVQTFKTTFHFLWECRGSFVGSNIKLDVLQIKGDCYLEHGMDRICGLVRALHEQGFYKRLYFEAYFIYDEDWSEICNLPAIEGLHLGAIETPIVLLPSMTSIRELSFKWGSSHENPEDFAKSLTNVERIHIHQGELIDILPYVRHSAKVKKIRIDHLAGETQNEFDTIDLVALNEERRKLAGACKQTIYVEENFYLTTKWAGKPTKCSLVQLERVEACEWKTWKSYP